MKRPKHCKIGGIKVNIVPLDEKHSANFWGLWQEANHTIYLNQDLFGTDKEKVVFLHEAVHAIDSFCSESLSEEQVDRFSKALFAFLRDNPKVIAWLLDSDD